MECALPGGAIAAALARAAAGMLQVALSDTLSGVPPEETPVLFDRLFRGRDVAKNGSSGTGLGVYASRSVLARHAGTIAIESEAGRGSTPRV